MVNKKSIHRRAVVQLRRDVLTSISRREEAERKQRRLLESLDDSNLTRFLTSAPIATATTPARTTAKLSEGMNLDEFHRRLVTGR